MTGVTSCNLKSIFAMLSLSLALLYVAFLFLIPTQIPKYLLLLFSVLSIVLNYKEIFSRETLRRFWIFFRPWLPWLVSIVVLAVIYGSSGFSRYLNTFLILILFYLGLSRLRFDRNLVLYMLGLSSVVVSVIIFTYVQVEGLDAHIFEYNKNKLMYPVTLVSVTCLIALLFEYKQLPKLLRNLILFGFLCSVLTLAATEVRGAVLGYLAVIPVLLLNSFRISKRTLVIFISLLVVLVLLFFASGRIQGALRDIELLLSNNANTSLGIRFTLWKTSMEAFFASPFIGWGPETYRAYSQSGLMFAPLPSYIDFTHFHSDFFQLLVVGGGLGIACWLVTCIGLGFSAKLNPYKQALLFSSLAMGLTEPFWTRWLSLFSFALLWVIFSLEGSSKEAVIRDIKL